MIVNSWTRSEYYRIKAALHGKVPTRMELFRMMKEPQYLSYIEKSKENIFRQYLAALEEMGELSAEDEKLKMSRLQKNRTSEKKSCFYAKAPAGTAFLSNTFSESHPAIPAAWLHNDNTALPNRLRLRRWYRYHCRG